MDLGFLGKSICANAEGGNCHVWPPISSFMPSKKSEQLETVLGNTRIDIFQDWSGLPE